MATLIASVGEIVIAITIAGMADRMGPSVGTISSSPERRASGNAFGTPNAARQIQESVPINRQRRICPRSQAPSFSFILSMVDSMSV